MSLRAELLAAGQPPDTDAIWRELSKPVDQLATGAEYHLHRFQLPTRGLSSRLQSSSISNCIAASASL
jgi:hypothetical protein